MHTGEENEMGESQQLPPGSILWRDLTVADAEGIRDFYRAVVGWEFRPEDMGGYDDYHMLVPLTGERAAGIYHARGENADIPPAWLIYIVVEDIHESVGQCEALGGSVMVRPRQMGAGYFSVIQDPAGAVCALYQPVSLHQLEEPHLG